MPKRSTLHALAAVLLSGAALVGCGGGDAEAPPPPVGALPANAGPDTTAPSVQIASDVSAPTATGPVTFTFVFNEDVGVSFEAADVVVTGGTAGAFTRIGGTQATLVVTPAPNTSGAMTVSVASGRFTDIAGNANTATAAMSKNFDVRLPTAPTTAAPTPPARASGDVLSIFSDAYTAIPGIDLNPNWGQSTVPTTETIAGNATRKYATLNYQGIDFAGNPINVSTMTRLHIDLWTADVTSVLVSIISNGAENAVTLTPTLSSWNSFDIDLAQYTVPNKNAIIQIKIEGTPGGGTLYFDNLYFWKPAGSGGASCGTTAPTCAPTTTIPAGSTVIYSDAASITPLDTAPFWDQAPPVNATEVTIAGNKSMRYTFGALYQGIDWSGNPQNVTTKGTLHLDVWTANVASVKVSLIGGGSENGITKTLTAGSWTSIDIPLNQYTSPNLAAIIQMKLEPNVAGTIYVDNIYFHGTASAGGGGSSTFTGGIFASDYSGNLGAGTAKSDKNGTVGFFVDPRLFAVKVFEDGSVCGSACNPGGIFNFYYGIGKPATPTYADAFFGGFVNAPGNTTADASPFAKVKLKFWGDAESWEKTNFTAQVDVILQGPANAACSNPSGRPEITKTVAAQKIGAGSDYVIPKTDFTLTASCGGAYTVDTVWSAVGAVVVRLTGTGNLNYVNLTPSTPPSYPTFLNIGPISFIN